MTLCNRFGSKDALLRTALGTMLAEHPNEPIEGEAWQDSLRRVAHHHRAMALARPNTFMLFLQIPPYASPILEHTEQMFNVHLWQDLPNDMPFIFLSIMHAFLPGFQLAEGYSAKADFDNLPENAKRFATLFNEKTFERNLDIIIAGLEAKYGLARAQDSCLSVRLLPEHRTLPWA